MCHPPPCNTPTDGYRSDLHLYVHAMPVMRAGDVLGHEFMGIVDSVSSKGTAGGQPGPFAGCSWLQRVVVLRAGAV